MIEVEQGAGVVASGLRRYLQEHTDIKPLISSFCPAVVRLIQNRWRSGSNSPCDAIAGTVVESAIRVVRVGAHRARNCLRECSFGVL